MEEIRNNAKKLMQGYCRVCRVCDGRICAGEVPGMGGLGTGSAFGANLKALDRWKFNMRPLHDIDKPDTQITLMGKKLSLPVLAAPIGGISFNMGGQVCEEDYIDAVLGGCIDQGTLGCVGDGVPEFIHKAGYASIKAYNGKGIPFIKPWENHEWERKLEKALDTGASMIGVDVDAAGLVTLKQMGKPVVPKSGKKLRRIIEKLPTKFIIKGVMTKQDAKVAVDIGAHGIVSVHPEVVDFGSGQGRSEFATAGVAALRRGLQRSENAGLGQKMPFMDGH